MLERGIITVVAADGAMAVLVVVVSPGTGEEEFGEEGLTLMPVAVLTIVLKPNPVIDPVK